jgi:excinuclease ABC subunit A
LTSKYLKGEKKIEIPVSRRVGNGKVIKLKGCTGNNHKRVDAEFPLGKFICVTGVSGSGKSTLVNETLQPILSQHFYHSLLDPYHMKLLKGLNL